MGLKDRQKNADGNRVTEGGGRPLFEHNGIHVVEIVAAGEFQSQQQDKQWGFIDWKLLETFNDEIQGLVGQEFRLLLDPDRSFKHGDKYDYPDVDTFDRLMMAAGERFGIPKSKVWDAVVGYEKVAEDGEVTFIPGDPEYLKGEQFPLKTWITAKGFVKYKFLLEADLEKMAEAEAE